MDTDSTASPVRVEYTWLGSSSRVASLSAFGDVVRASAQEVMASVVEEDAVALPHPSVGSVGSQSETALGGRVVTVGADSTFTPLVGV